MPICYEVSDGGHFINTRATGVITEEDLLRYQAALLADPRIKPGAYELFDATMANCSDLSDEVIPKIVESDRAHGERLRGGKCAVVVRAAFELADKLETAHAGPHELMVFYNLDVARAWLGKSN